MHPIPDAAGTRDRNGLSGPVKPQGFQMAADHTFYDLFKQFFWLIFPILGMGMGAFAIWNEFSRQKKALEVLKIYAEKGQEPPDSVMRVLNQASSPRQRGGDRGNPLAGAAFFGVLSAGFAAMALWTYFNNGPQQFITGWVIAAIALGALFASHLVRAIMARRQNDL
jgi:hypothetical protein